MSREEHRAAVEAGYASPAGYVERDPLPHAVPIKHDIFTFFDAIAKREGTPAHVVINDELRRMMGDR